ncbi:hypothetical protein L3V77_15975 [Vibrio sp. DW001]|uniref:hypothetical protein n=1 Tax=Vibrio sp. DW001 TaxID=2912315 RepID=UPI0023AF1225|nr:hypothetical protein [Vibrio sp. DW001]WED26472.1 hypothetical protein L3V77_15975 [Vibrio sp. DW001]
MQKIKVLVILALVMVSSGCATRLEATMSPGQELKDFGNVYVEHFGPDKRNMHYIIADKLTMLGYPATPIEENGSPKNADVIITYVDNWQWDITNYLIQIKIDARNDKRHLLISGESYRTSLARKEPEFMIQETLEKILQEAGLKYNHLPE